MRKNGEGGNGNRNAFDIAFETRNYGFIQAKMNIALGCLEDMRDGVLRDHELYKDAYNLAPLFDEAITSVGNIVFCLEKAEQELYDESLDLTNKYEEVMYEGRESN